MRGEIMIYGNGLKYCPRCGRRLKHKLGSNKWWCGYCRLHFYKTPVGIYVKRSGTEKIGVRIEKVLEEEKSGSGIFTRERY